MFLISPAKTIDELLSEDQKAKFLACFKDVSSPFLAYFKGVPPLRNLMWPVPWQMPNSRQSEILVLSNIFQNLSPNAPD